MKRFYTTLLVTFLFFCYVTTFSQFSGGAGTQDDPFLVSTLNELRVVDYFPSSHFKQIADIDASQSKEDKYSFTPIGTEQTPFSGSYDGNGFYIYDLYYTSTDKDIALFCYINDAMLEDIELINCEFIQSENVNTDNTIKTAGLVANCFDSNVLDCSASGTINGMQVVGGLVGYAENSTISQSFFVGTVESVDDSEQSSVGGFISQTVNSDISHSNCHIRVKGTSNVGGFVGTASSGSIINCYVNGKVNGDMYVSGFGSDGADCTFNNCYSSCVVDTKFTPYGFVAKGTKELILNCFYNADNYDAYDGGFAHPITTNDLKNKEVFTDWDFTNEWSFENDAQQPQLRRVYDFITLQNKKIDSVNVDVSYSASSCIIPFDINGSSKYDVINKPSGLIYDPEKQLVEWDVNESGDHLVQIKVTDDKGRNLIQEFVISVFGLQGEGTEESPYLIHNYSELKQANHNLKAYYKLVNDIDASASAKLDITNTFFPIGSEDTPFEGVFDGNRKTISHLELRMVRGNTLGVFGNTLNAFIENVYVSATINEEYVYRSGGIIGSAVNTLIYDCSFSGTLMRAYECGGIVGYAEDSKISGCVTKGNFYGLMDCGGIAGKVHSSNIYDCHSESTVLSRTQAGGLIGTVSNSTKVSFCSASGNVTALPDTLSPFAYAGGLIGKAESVSLIEKSYSVGTVEGERTSGGLIGVLNWHNTVKNCYSHSDVKVHNYGAGGFFGEITYEGNDIQYCYSTGIVYCDEKAGGFGGVGAINVNASNTLANNYFDRSTSNQTADEGASAKYTSEMYDISLYDAWDFETVWAKDSEEQYPYLKNHTNGPAIISDAPTETKEDVMFYYKVLVEDPNNNFDELTFELRNQPEGMLFDENIIKWTPINNVKTSGEVTVIVTDPDGNSAEQKFTLSVNIINTHAPKLLSVVDLITPPNEPISMRGAIELKEDEDDDTFTVIVADGDNYTVNGEMIIPDWNFVGVLTVPVAISDGDLQSEYSTAYVAVGSSDEFYGGHGIEADPYIIITYDQLNSIRHYLNAHFKLGADIDASESLMEPFEPIGTDEDKFIGGLDGNGFIIDRIKITSDSIGTALFWSAENAVFKNITITNAIVERLRGNALAGYVGNVASVLLGDGYGVTIQNCSTNGAVQGVGITGGLVGRMQDGSQINNSYFYGTVNSSSFSVGGLVGKAIESTINNSYSSAQIHGLGYAGGFIGEAENSEIFNCYASGYIYGQRLTGGFAGECYESTVAECYSTMYTDGQESIASFASINTRSSFAHCFYNSDLSNAGVIDGVDAVSTYEAKMKETYDKFDITIWENDDDVTFGRLNSLYDVPIILSYPQTVIKKGELFTYELEALGMDNIDITYQLSNKPEGMEVSADGVVTWTANETGVHDYGILVIDGNGYVVYQPLQINVHDLEGTGYPSDPYKVTTYDQLQQVAYFSNKDFVQTADIIAPADFSEEFQSIGSSMKHFKGNYDGGGYNITNINIPATGLFGYVEGSQITNCNVVVDKAVQGGIVGVAETDCLISDCSFSGTIKSTGDAGAIVTTLRENSVVQNCNSSGSMEVSGGGGIVTDANKSYINNCYSSMKITGSWETGGIVASISGGGLKQCYATGDVTGGYAGGLIGRSGYGVVVDECYASGNVTGDSYVGGLAGEAGYGSSFTNCFAHGNVMAETYNAGGFAGYASDGTDIVNCYSVGSVDAARDFGGFCSSISYYSGKVVNSYYDMKTSKHNDADYATPLLTDVLYEKTTFTDWDFETIWGIVEGENYPYLRAFKYPLEIVSEAPTEAFALTEYVYTVMVDDLDNGYSGVSYTLENEPEGMIVTYNQITWTPTTSQETSGEVTVTVTDPDGHSDTQLFTVSVTNNNIPPVVDDISAELNEDASVEITLIASDADGAIDYFKVLTPPANGEFVITDDKLLYTPAKGYSGVDEIKYTAYDDFGDMGNEGVITISVVALPNVLPIAENVTVSVYLNKEKEIILEGSDSDGEIVEYRLINKPENGSVTLNKDVVEYIPNVDFLGTDSFTYIVIDDEEGESEPATVSIEVIEVPNIAPVADDIEVNILINQDLKLELPGSDVDGSVVYRWIIEKPEKGTFKLTGSTAYYQPVFNEEYTETFTYKVRDNDLAVSDTGTVTINVVPRTITVQYLLDKGTPILTILESYPVDSLIGKTFLDGFIADVNERTGGGFVIEKESKPNDNNWINAVGLYSNMDEWHLPNVEELVAVYNNLILNGYNSFLKGDADYWSSEEGEYGKGKYVSLKTGEVAEIGKTAYNEMILINHFMNDSGYPIDNDGDGVADADDVCPGSGDIDNVDFRGCVYSDSDYDGVPNIYDECYNTPRDVVVDKNGCEIVLDSDGDGVADGVDKCPDTPADTEVDYYGCEVVVVVDSDNDGVADADDECPDTPADAVVDAKGCKVVVIVDSDNDGVADADDECPNTPADAVVDAKGCEVVVIVDSDNDGVADSDDECPDTPADVEVDDKGCEVVVIVDSDNDGVADEDDECPDTPADAVVDAKGCEVKLADYDGDGIPNETDEDDDNDGVADIDDAFPLDETESVDTDGDGIGNNADTDDDNDGLVDENDAFPLDKTEWADTDSDGVGNNSDADDDGDGVADAEDAFPLDKSESNDNDEDGIGDNADMDDDNDGIVDVDDQNPLTPDFPVDTDGDGTPDVDDLDDDNDGVADVDDAFPLNKNESLDTDADGIGNNADDDDDGDGVADIADAFPLDKTEAIDTDEDGIGNNADTDDDGDGVADAEDTFPLDKSESTDNDGDGTGDNADTDDDNDGVADVDDVFPLDGTESVDTDADGIGNNADADDDGDGVADAEDAFPLDKSESTDNDGDGTGDNADADDDNDGVADSEDSFPLDDSETSDNDNDGVGDNEDTDDDNDGIADEFDHNPFTPDTIKELTLSVESITVDVVSGEAFDEIDLNSYIISEYVAEELSWAKTGDLNLVVSLDNATARIALFNQGWFGKEVVTFTVTDKKGASLDLAVTFNVTQPTTGIGEEVGIVDLKAYPSPATGETVTVTGNILAGNKTELFMYNILGEKIAVEIVSMQNNKTMLDISMLSKGVYIIEARTKTKTEQQTILVE